MENKRNLLESEVDLKDLIVIDNGTDTIKMGYSGENYPRVIFLNRYALTPWQESSIEPKTMIKFQINHSTFSEINLNKHYKKKN